MPSLSRLVRRARDKITNRDAYYIDGITLERVLKMAAPGIHDNYLSQIRGLSGSLMGAILSTVQAVFLPHFIVPAVFNFAFLGHYSIRIHTMRKWAKLEGVRLARRTEVITHIVGGIIVKLFANAITLGHADFALIADALLHVKDGVEGLGNASKLLEILDQAQADWADNQVISGLNTGLGAPLTAAENSIGIGGETVTWGETLSAGQITELEFANEAGDLMAQAVLEEPADKAFEHGLASSSWRKKYAAENDKDEWEDSSATEFEVNFESEDYYPQITSPYMDYMVSPDPTSTSTASTRLRSTYAQPSKPPFQSRVGTKAGQKPTPVPSRNQFSPRTFPASSACKVLGDKKNEALHSTRHVAASNMGNTVAQVSAVGATLTAIAGGIWYFFG